MVLLASIEPPPPTPDGYLRHKATKVDRKQVREGSGILIHTKLNTLWG
jgi:hypothetical protein